MRALLFAVLSTMTVVTTAFSQTTRPATTRPDQSPILADNTVVHPDILYGPDPAFDRLDIYAPKDAKNAPVLLFVHGGEWTRGDKREISYKPQFFNAHQIVFVSINYRLTPKYKHPAQVDDVAAAIAWVHTHIAEDGGDPDKIVIMGHSAGCHLVTLVALDPDPLAAVGLKSSAVRGVIAWSGGMYDLVAKAQAPGMYPPYIKATFGDSVDAQRAGSPETYVANAKDAPPFLFASCDDAKSQPSRDATDEMVRKILDNGGKVQTTILANRAHFFANHLIGAPGDQTGAMLLNFIDYVTE